MQSTIVAQPPSELPIELPQEMHALAGNPEPIRFYADQIRTNGFTVIENALPLSFIEAMRARFDTLLEAYRDANPTNRGANRFQMYLPFELPFSSPLLYAHPVVLAIVGEVLPKPFLLDYLASDTPFPGSDYQAVHADCGPLFPGAKMAVPPFSLVLNVPLVDVTEENGPLEIWPGGTHHFLDSVNIAALAPTMVSQRLTMKAGGILLRDPRVWHRGTPNRGSRSRPNIALVYTAPWYRFPQKPPTLRKADFEALNEQDKTLLRHATLLDG